MTERGLPSADGSQACPFVAFDEDRDERAPGPDHRHRCYAETPPAPRALAHQEAYCLSSAFPVCPVFQEWARREAARAREMPAAPETEVVPATLVAAVDDDATGAPEAGSGAAVIAAADEGDPAQTGTATDDERPRRNPPRDWAAPPPWASGAGAVGAAEAGAETGFVSGSSPRSAAAGAADQSGRRPEGQGLAGSSADRIATGGPVIPPTTSQGGSSASGSSGADRPAGRSAAADPDLAGLVAPGAAIAPRAGKGYPPPTRAGRRPSVSSTRIGGSERERERAAPTTHDGPSWERVRRYEAYPTIKTRAGLPGLPGVPRIILFGGALGIAAIALFFLPALFGVGGDDPGPSPTPSELIATPSPEPTPEPEPTPQAYTIKSGDTLSSIAREFKVTLDDLLAANKKTIKDPDRIKVGDEIIIPVPPPAEEEAAPSEATPTEAAPTEES